MRPWADLTEMEKTDRARFHVLGLKERAVDFATANGAALSDIEERCSERGVLDTTQVTVNELRTHLQLLLKTIEADALPTAKGTPKQGSGTWRLAKALGISLDVVNRILTKDVGEKDHGPTKGTITKIMQMQPNDLIWRPDSGILNRLFKARMAGEAFDQTETPLTGEKGKYAAHLVHRLGWNRQQVCTVLGLSYGHVNRILDEHK